MRKIENVQTSMNAPSWGEYENAFFVQVDQTKCEGCGECESQCPTGAIQCIDGDDGPRTVVNPAACVNCGQCLINCPYGAIYEGVSFVEEIFSALKDPDKVVVSMPAPAVRYGLAEAFGHPTGTYSGGKMFAALKKLGFDHIWDNQWTADVTIMEEGSELLGRLTGKVKKPLPQFTSCCPGWIKFVETFYPELIPNLSTCKSPVGMLGTLCKTYGAEIIHTEPKKIYTVSIMPCIAKKFEGLRPEIADSGYRDIDATITTRELAYMIKKSGIDFNSLPDVEPDTELGESTGAATIFGCSGGVMEAALRFAYEAVSGQALESVDIKAVRSRNGVKEATIPVPKFGDLNVCVVSGLFNTIPILEEIKKGKSRYHFIEVMTCPGGCVNGGGQPLLPDVREASLFKHIVARINRRFNMRKAV
ncbi:MAG: [FeFe] hydrogenase, group A [Desulfobacterales bacterium]|nr:[FeFe] hydrogenase, group A [Desulfobacterales bacterium]MDD4073142.1 [FeFe] hydrogenase, group A [Desulfobacterales bacterium]MDD4393594.1 [FeFe] hydrogenase, group A [Desulfobacterales bacterium]